MFDVRFMFQGAREGMDRDQLYRYEVTRIKRYLKTSDYQVLSGLSSDVITDISSKNLTVGESKMDTEDGGMPYENGYELPSLEFEG